MHEGFGLTLGAFLLLSLVNGSAIEIARKSWAPEQEREGVETYSKTWQPGPSGVAVMSIVGGAGAVGVHQCALAGGCGFWAAAAGERVGGVDGDRLRRNTDAEDLKGHGNVERRLCAV